MDVGKDLRITSKRRKEKEKYIHDNWKRKNVRRNNLGETEEKNMNNW